ncbi:glycosyltransferase family 4 protein [Actinomyces vulturis]|uniref:glycosyltransferase family 4 protein n=1 Tax=Actinomyces vulturis TaxID=1857645 RepID=UPI00082AC11E|nr:glycosyltransferase family 4 protein [Actinomyces vulturis]
MLVGGKFRFPVVQFSEAIFSALVDYYPLYTNLSLSARAQGSIISNYSYRVTDRFVASSEWVKSKIHAESSKPVDVAPIGPGIDCGIQGFTSSPMKKTGHFSILLVAREWDRKDGDRAVAVARAMHERDKSVRLTVIGKQLPQENWLRSFSRVDRDDLAELYREHDVVFEFTKANTGGVVIADSFSASTPVIATYTGAVPSLIENGVNGMLIGVNESVNDVVSRVECLKDISVAEHFRKKAFEKYETSYNWDVWASSVVEVLESAASK